MKSPIVVFHDGSLSILEFDGYWLMFLAEAPIRLDEESMVNVVPVKNGETTLKPHQLWQTIVAMLGFIDIGFYQIRNRFVWEVKVDVNDNPDGIIRKTVTFRCAATSTPDHWAGTSYKSEVIHAMPVYDNDILEKLRMFLDCQ
jgi:hypothetical protein